MDHLVPTTLNSSETHNKSKHADLVKLSPFSLAQKSRQLHQARYVSMKVLIAAIFLFSFTSSACELTSEYKDLRRQVTDEVRASYRECIKTTKSYFFYKAVAECMDEGRGVDVAGGCYHIVGYEVTYQPEDIEHCSVLKPTAEQFAEYMEIASEEKGVQRCKY